MIPPTHYFLHFIGDMCVCVVCGAWCVVRCVVWCVVCACACVCAHVRPGRCCETFLLLILQLLLGAIQSAWVANIGGGGWGGGGGVKQARAILEAPHQRWKLVDFQAADRISLKVNLDNSGAPTFVGVMIRIFFQMVCKIAGGDTVSNCN